MVGFAQWRVELNHITSRIQRGKLFGGDWRFHMSKKRICVKIGHQPKVKLELSQKPQIIFVKEPDVVDAITDHGDAFDAEASQAKVRRPLGCGIVRPSDFAVAIHSSMIASTFLRAACRVGPSAAQPGNSGTSATNAWSSSLQ